MNEVNHIILRYIKQNMKKVAIYSGSVVKTQI